MKSFDDNYHYVLFVIDYEPLKYKSGISVATALRKIFFNNKDKLPIFYQTDRGREFTAKVVLDVFKEYNIEFRLIHNPHEKAAIAERVIQIIKHRLWSFFMYKNTQIYIDVLPSIVHSYHNTIHSGIIMTPASVNLNNSDIARFNLTKRYSLKRKFHKIPKYKAETLV